MTKIIIALCSLLIVFLSFYLFSFSISVYAAIIVAAALSVLASLRSDDTSRISLIALDLLFMLLIMVVFKNTLIEQTIELYILFISVSLIFGSAETIIFHNKRMHPALGLLFTVFFWAPLSIPVFFIVENKLGTLGGVAVVVVLFLIAVRDIFRRKKETFKE